MANDNQEIIKEKSPRRRLSGKNKTDEMSFLEHLEELRWRIIKGCIGIAVGVIIAYVFHHFLIDVILLGPTKPNFFMYQIFGIHSETVHLISRRLSGQFLHTGEPCLW